MTGDICSRLFSLVESILLQHTVHMKRAARIPSPPLPVQPDR